MITAKMVAHSKNIFDHELATMVVTFPRYILAEFNTHRMFSRNSASSRAIPAKKMFKLLDENPFTPMAWQIDHKGMQGTEYHQNSEHLVELRNSWLRAKDKAVEESVYMNIDHFATKQITNRLLEPFMWHTVIVTSSEWENFFKLRCPQYQNIKYLGRDAATFRSKKDYLSFYEEEGDVDEITWLKRNRGKADIHMMALAEAMWDAYNESTPKLLQPGEWHIPFGDNIDLRRLAVSFTKFKGNPMNLPLDVEDFRLDFHTEEAAKAQVAVARCARVSYLNYEGTDDYVKDFELFEKLKDDIHESPFEHVAKAMGREDLDNYMKIENGKVSVGWCRNFCGFIQMRAMMSE